MWRAAVVPVFVFLIGCATDPVVPASRAAPVVLAPPKVAAPATQAVPAPALAAAPAPPVASEVETKHMSEKEWLVKTRQQIAGRWNIAGEELRFSPARTLVAFVQAPSVRVQKRPAKHPQPRVFTIVVVDVMGRRQHAFRPVRPRGQDEPPKDMQFLGEDRLVYEVVLPAPGPPPPPRRGSKRKVATAAPAGAPERLFVIQPVRSRARPISCQAARFAFNARKDHLACVGGKPGAQGVFVDGARVYPRGRGQTVVASDPAWSKDQLALAFLEQRPAGGLRLVLIADPGNPTGDTNWDLPASAAGEGLQVFWPSAQKLVVGRSIAAPMFATTFAIDRPEGEK